METRQDNQNTLIHKFRKSDNEEFQICLRQYQNRQFIDIRLWYMPPTQKQFRPTKKGITMGAEFLPDLRKAFSMVKDKFCDSNSVIRKEE